MHVVGVMLFDRNNLGSSRIEAGELKDICYGGGSGLPNDGRGESLR